MKKFIGLSVILAVLLANVEIGYGYAIYNPYRNYDHWWKGQVHVHTAQHGPYEPNKTMEEYKKKGFNFVALTDHIGENPDVFTSGTFPGILPIKNSAQLSSSGPHTIALNITNPEYYNSVPGIPNPSVFLQDHIHEKMVKYIVKHGGLAIAAHPSDKTYSWPETPKDTLQTTQGLLGLEIYNGKRPKLSATAIKRWDNALKNNVRLWGFATDDLHNPSHLNKGWIMVNSPYPTTDVSDTAKHPLLQESIIENIKDGNFYAVRRVKASDNATTPLLTVKASSNKIKVTTDKNDQHFKFVWNNGSKWKSDENTDPNKSTASFLLTNATDSNYVRVVVADNKINENNPSNTEHVLWSQPLFVSSDGQDRIQLSTPNYNHPKPPKRLGNWSALIDRYGRIESLKYWYPADEGGLIDEIFDWAGFVSYKKNGELKQSWLYDFPYNNTEWVDPGPNDWAVGRPIKDVKSRIWNEDLSVEIWSGIYEWETNNDVKYKLCQQYTFTNLSGVTLEDIRYYQYIDPDIGTDMGTKDWGKAPAYFDGPPIYPHNAVWIINKENEWRGYGFGCLGYPQPTCWYGRFSGELEGAKVGSPSDVIAAIWKDYDSPLTGSPNPITGDVAGVIRWKLSPTGETEGKLAPGESIDVEIGLYVIPEPCTLLLMGTGIAGLAGIARRRKTKHHA